ncbi:MAG: LysR family transcriptional regulator [Desertimonas sp.]
MDVRQLAALVAVADHGTFSAAARALFTVQSNVSSHVARLERELGTTLVDRSAGRLTEDGTRVVERARRVLRELDDIAHDVRPGDGDIIGDVRVGILGTTGKWLLPRLLDALRDQHPHLRPIITEGSSSTLLPTLDRYNGVIVHLPVDDPGVVIEPLYAEDLVLVSPPDHPLADADSVSLAALSGHPLLLPPAGSALRRVLDRAAGTLGVTLSAHAEVDGVRLLANLALAGQGATIVPATAVATLGIPPLVPPIAVTGLPPRVVALIYPRQPSPSAATRALFALLRETVTGLAEDQPGVHLGSDAVPLSRRG